MKPSQFTEKGTDYASDKPINADPEFPVYPEMQSYCHELPLLESELRKNNKTPTFGKIDDVSGKGANQ